MKPVIISSGNIGTETYDTNRKPNISISGNNLVFMKRMFKLVNVMANLTHKNYANLFYRLNFKLILQIKNLNGGMNITLLVIGKTDETYLKEGLNVYTKRLKHYINFKIEVIPEVKKSGNPNSERQKEMEEKQILSKISKGKEIHLFDENGKMFTSRGFATFLGKKMASGLKDLVLVRVHSPERRRLDDGHL